jgi:hypothetical protein
MSFLGCFSTQKFQKFSKNQKTAQSECNAKESTETMLGNCKMAEIKRWNLSFTSSVVSLPSTLQQTA